jgi:cell wall-associated NlpC family hydrolase
VKDGDRVFFGWMLRELSEWGVALALVLLLPWAHYHQSLAPGLEQVQVLQGQLHLEMQRLDPDKWERWAGRAMQRMQAQVIGIGRRLDGSGAIDLSRGGIGHTGRHTQTKAAGGDTQKNKPIPMLRTADLPSVTLRSMPASSRMVRRGGVGPEDVVWTALNRYYAAPYRYGGESVLGIDCSALVQGVFRDLGVGLPRTAQRQFDAKVGVYVGVENLLPGDLVFFHTRRQPYVSHVGIYLGENEFLHAPRTGRRVEIAAFTGYYRQRFIAGKRILADPFSAYQSTGSGG